MKHLFEKLSSNWVKYSEYAFCETQDGELFIAPAPDAEPIIIDPLEDAEQMVLDALNVGMIQMRGVPAEADEVKGALGYFVSKYGLLGFITALPTTPHFTSYDAAYLPKNQFIRAESMPVTDYIEQFFPFGAPDFKVEKDGAFSLTFDTSEDNTYTIAQALTFAEVPSKNLSFHRDYCERYDWLAAQFKDWAYLFTGSHLYYIDREKTAEENLVGYKLGVAAFPYVTPTYHIELLDKPTIVWDFHSLLLGIQMMFSFMLTDAKKPLKLCKQCQQVFVSGRKDAAFCSGKCKNVYNVAKNREKDK